MGATRDGPPPEGSPELEAFQLWHCLHTEGQDHGLLHPASGAQVQEVTPSKAALRCLMVTNGAKGVPADAQDRN